MNTNIYLHTLYTSRYYSLNKTLYLLEQILKSDSLLSLRNQGKESKKNFCGDDFISLIDLEKRNLFKNNNYNGYLSFGKNKTSILFPKDSFDVYRPVVLEKRIDEYPNSFSLMYKLGINSDKRYTDLLDEVQVKDKIDLKYMIGLMIPTCEIINYYKSDIKNIDILKRELEVYKELLIKYSKDVPFYDSITFNSLDSYDDLKNTIVMIRKKNY